MDLREERIMTMASGCLIILRALILWSPTPSVAYLVLRQLGESVQKRPNSLYVFICPKLTMLVWGGLMFNMADLVLYVPPGGKCWPSSIHESFVLGSIFPLIPHRTWRIRGAPKVIGMGRTVYFLLQESPMDAGSVIYQLWLLPKRVTSISRVLERVLLLI